MRKLTKTEYNNVHKWNLRNWQKTSICEFCLVNIKTEWANKTGEYLKGVRSDWLELCKQCHVKYDVERRHSDGWTARKRDCLTYIGQTKPAVFTSIIDGLIKEV
jgi:hypothetical protein